MKLISFLCLIVFMFCGCRSNIAHSAVNPQIEKLALTLSFQMREQFRSIVYPLKSSRMSATDPSSSPSAVNYNTECEDVDLALKKIIALSEAGDFYSCIALADNCTQKFRRGENFLNNVLVEGAVCATNSFQFEKAKFFFQESLVENYDESSIYLGTLYLYAKFIYTNFNLDESEIENILKKSSFLTVADRANLKEFLTYLVQGGVIDDNKLLEIIGLTKRSYSFADYIFSEHLIADILYAFAKHHKDDKKALEFITNYHKKFIRPSLWFWGSYIAFYRQDKDNFKFAGKLYDAFLEEANPLSSLPLERMTYTYSELKESVCKNYFLRGDALKKFLSIKNDWLQGKTNLNDTLKKALDLSLSENNNKTDLLIFIGSLYLNKSDGYRAQKYFWDAHKICPYNNRSHRGLEVVARKRKQKAYADFQTLLDDMTAQVSKLNFSENLSRYVVNYNILSDGGVEKLKYAMRFFVKHIDSLYNDGLRLYLKDVFELLSETPNNDYLQDRRLQSAGYEGDNRLWDDLRGSGGDMAVVDLYETLGAVFGEYRLASHEVAHQFYANLLSDDIKACVKNLYLDAKKRNMISDPYAARNELEYFAQAVAHYTVDEDAPSRFGINRKWLQKNDPKLFSLVKSIESTSDLSKIKCP
ncbi:MAG: hypothetical protein HQK49_00760 [Oligoflexia bacterium]|nr:hypothetical protein [Oligoflexia bacterium]